MQDVHYRLSVLTKVVQHKNLSAAADHVGLSQPQLSRVIAKLEDELQVMLLDRGVRRKSGWTKTALELAEVFVKNEILLQNSIQKIMGKQLYSTIRIGALEGLATLAMFFVRAIFEELEIREVHLDIFEIGELEGRFESGELDLIFSFKVPGRQKYKNVIEVGYQSIKPIDTEGEFLVYSPYEFSQYKIKGQKTKKKVFLSNSLYLRKQWLQKFKGIGLLPSKISLKSIDGTFPLYLVGSELLNPKIWEKVMNTPRCEEMLNAKLFEV